MLRGAIRGIADTYIKESIATERELPCIVG